MRGLDGDVKLLNGAGGCTIFWELCWVGKCGPGIEVVCATGLIVDRWGDLSWSLGDLCV